MITKNEIENEYMAVNILLKGIMAVNMVTRGMEK